MSALTMEILGLEDKARDRISEIDDEIQALRVERGNLERIFQLKAPYGAGADAIRSVLADGEVHRAAEIVAVAPRNTVYQNLGRLRSAGEVERVSKGFYRIVRETAA